MGTTASMQTTIGEDFPIGLALTSLVGSYFKADEVAQCFIALHRRLGTHGATPLDFHFPEAVPGNHWAVLPDAPPPALTWWAHLTPPFPAYSRPDMERRIVTFPSDLSDRPTFRLVDYEMWATRISDNGLRFKVSDANPAKGIPELWVLAAQTQETP